MPHLDECGQSCALIAVHGTFCALKYMGWGGTVRKIGIWEGMSDTMVTIRFIRLYNVRRIRHISRGSSMGHELTNGEMAAMNHVIELRPKFMHKFDQYRLDRCRVI